MCKECKLNDKRCYLATGPITATVFIAGEAPSTHRKSPIHFSEKSKPTFDKFLEMIGVSYDEAWITNAVKCIEPDKRRGMSNSCKRYLKEEIKIVKPREVFMLGNIAMLAIFGKKLPYKSFKWHGDGIVYHALPHPMTAIYDQGTKRSLFFNAVKSAIDYREKHNLHVQQQTTLFGGENGN